MALKPLIAGQFYTSGGGGVTVPSTTNLLAGDGSGGIADSLIGVSSGRLTLSANGAASTPVMKFTGSLFTGGSGTTTQPLMLLEPTGATASTTWSTSGTLLGLNSPNGFSGDFMRICVDGAQCLRLNCGNFNITTIYGDSTYGTIYFAATAQWISGNIVCGGGSLIVTNNNVTTGASFDGSTTGGLITMNAGATACEYRITGTTTGPKYLSLKHDGTDAYISTNSGTMRIKGLPTSSAGLASGTLWNNSGVVNVA